MSRHRLLVAAVCGVAAVAALVGGGDYWDRQVRLARTRSAVAETAIRVRASLEEWPSGHPLPAVQCAPDGVPTPGIDGVESWRGVWARTSPILGASAVPDGWGRCLVVNLDDSNALRPVWVVSAGLNGRLETRPDGQGPRGDDVAIRVR